jgi:ribosomal protein S25
MKLINIEKLDRIHNMIRREATGTPEEFAERLKISRSTLFNTLKYLKENMDAPIIYNNSKKSYTYKYKPKFHLGFEEDNNQ